MARAIWKAVVQIGKLSLPVKLYSAVEDHSVRFRLLHKTDLAPVKQELISAESEDPIEYRETRKAFPIGGGKLVVLDPDELEQIEPEESRDIEITRFVDPESIDHRWFERAWYLGPDGSSSAYFAAAEALEKKGKTGVARWVMRDKEYVGALHADAGYLMLIALRHASEVIDASALNAPEGRALDKREIAMAEQLLSALEDKFDPSQYQDDYRARVMDLVATKARGGRVKVKAFRPRKTKDDSLTSALEASLAGLNRRKTGSGS